MREIAKKSLLTTAVAVISHAWCCPLRNSLLSIQKGTRPCRHAPLPQSYNLPVEQPAVTRWPLRPW